MRSSRLLQKEQSIFGEAQLEKNSAALERITLEPGLPSQEPAVMGEHVEEERQNASRDSASFGGSNVLFSSSSSCDVKNSKAWRPLFLERRT